MSDYLGVGTLHRLRTVVARDGDVVAVYDMEACLHRLVVGDALRIAAFHQTDQSLRKRHGIFFHYFIVADNVDNGRRGDKCDAVEDALGEDYIGNFDYAFLSEFLRVEIVADRYRRVEILDTQNLNHLKKHRRGDMVDDSAVAKGGHCEFLLVDCHWFLFIRVDAERAADEGLTGIETVAGLIEIIGVGIIVDILCNLIDSGEWMENLHVLFRTVEH